ncbi:MAG: tetratricopeptide repeat protein [Deltaproteobacteria bacterium]|nr:tetratricopeptide repeat protein [Deltaproteobacteria bacterium]
MRQAGVIRYLVVAALLLLLAACGQFPGLRTPMPPTPAEPPPGAAAPAPAQAPAPAPDLAQQVQNLEAQVQQLESRLADLEGRKGVPVAAKARAVPPPSTPSPPKPAVSSAAADKHYTEGMRLYHAKKYGDARHQLYQYLKNQPRGPKAPEARYYLADSFYQEGKFREAGVEFNKLRLHSPKSILAPAGLLRQALCYKNQQQLGTYRSTLQKLVKAYPNSPEAKEAQKMLKESSKEATR